MNRAEKLLEPTIFFNLCIESPYNSGPKSLAQVKYCSSLRGYCLNMIGPGACI